MAEIDAEELRKEILEKIKTYYHAVFEQKKPFRRGDKIHYAGRVFDAGEMTAAADSVLDFWLTEGRYAAAFEEALKKFSGAPFASLTVSGSAANLLAFMSLTSPELGVHRIMRGDEVVTVAAGFPTTVAPIVQYGAVPVFIDVDSKTANVNPDLLEKALSKKTKAVVLAHTLGNPFNVDAVVHFCEQNGLLLLEDNCDALGSLWNDCPTGTFGHVSTGSFYPAHHITTGEGGVVFAKNPVLAKVVRSLRDWGRDCSCATGKDNSCGRRFKGQFGELPYGYDHKYVYSRFGYNLKMTEMQAAIGVKQMEKLSGFIEARRKNFEYLRDRLSELKEISVFENYEKAKPSWFGCLMTLTDKAAFSRGELSVYLEKNGIQTRNLFAGNLIRQPCFTALTKDVDYKVASALDQTDILMNRALWIGVYPALRREELDFMADKIIEFCRLKG